MSGAAPATSDGRGGCSRSMVGFLRRGLAVAVALLVAAPAAAAPMSPSFVGEPPDAGDVFRFPQALAVTPGGSTVFVGDEYSGRLQAFDAAGAAKFALEYRAARRESGRLG